MCLSYSCKGTALSRKVEVVGLNVLRLGVPSSALTLCLLYNKGKGCRLHISFYVIKNKAAATTFCEELSLVGSS